MTTRDPLAPLARAVAQHLPEGWTYADDPDFPGAIDGPEGTCVYLAIDHRGRGSISGALPNMYRIRYVSPDELKQARIGVSLSRPPRAIAREITRRLLPGYLPLHRRLSETVERHRDNERRREALAERIRRECPPELYVRVEPYDPLHVTLSAHLTEAQALAVCAALGRTVTASE